MTKETAKKFLDDNRDALTALANILRKERDIMLANSENIKSKQEAVKMVEKWISDLFGIAYSISDFPPDEEENLYRRLDKERLEDKGRQDVY